MNRRVKLHALLVEALGSKYVYFQPPTNIEMKYPCIVYSRSSTNDRFANNELYRTQKKYQITVIDKNPDSDIPGRIARLPMCRFDRHFKADNLNHDIYSIYY